MNPQRTLLVTVATLLAAPAWAHGDGPPLTSGLKYKASPKWTIILPNETWTSITGGIPIPHQGGPQFAALADSKALKLEVDTTGDGQTNATVKGERGYLLLSGKTADGSPLSYGARFMSAGAAGAGYKFASSGWMQGSLDGVSIRLIDQNNNGSFDEVGVDAMVIGNGNAASYVSKVINLKGNLYELSVQGAEISASPFKGETGQLDLAKGFAAKGKLSSAVVRSQDGSMSFELSDGSMTLPAANYQLAGGLVTNANETVRVGVGKSKRIEVAPGQEVGLAWGGDVIAEFSFSYSDGTVSIQPSALRYFGRAGEEYVGFLPEGASPKFLIHDAATGKLLKTGRFGGC